MRKIHFLWIAFFILGYFASFSQDGQLDASFGDNGFVQSDFFGLLDFGFDVAQQNDEAILAVGSSEIEPDKFVPTLARFLPDGNLDTSFGVDGVVVTDYNTQFGIDSYFNVVIPENQKIVTGGHFGSSSSHNIMLARYLSNGNLDPSFGNDGIAITDLGDDDRFRDMEILNNGKILILGTSKVNGYKLTFIQHLPDGSLDPSFGNNGILVTNKTVLSDAVLTLNVLEDNKILVSGEIGGEIKLLKYESDGNLDLSFGDDGVVITTPSSSYKSPLDIDAEGKIIVGLNRSVGNNESEGYLKRFLPDGSLDTSFGINGEAIINYVNFRPVSIIIQPNQQILILGDAYYGVDSVDCIVTRFRANGTLDTTFGSGGIATTSEVSGGNFILQEDGKIVWVGFSQFDIDLFLARYLNDPFTFGLNDQHLNNLEVYPNPSFGNFTIEHGFITDTDIPYYITDTSGKVLQIGNLSGNQTIINLSSLQSGLYFLNTENSSLRLIKE
ncbi:MAG: T9SS type A sorting domain-containing protein [Flavobacteriaceae bacterium]|nr:T9SS type A sorting domain-containing protein [Flavobacteriaceae bacterium]